MTEWENDRNSEMKERRLILEENRRGRSIRRKQKSERERERKSIDARVREKERERERARERERERAIREIKERENT